MSKIASNLQIDSARLWDTIHETAKLSATQKGGVRRLTFEPEVKQVRNWCRKAFKNRAPTRWISITLGSMFPPAQGPRHVETSV